MYNNCVKIAREKARYTMDYSQSLVLRPPEEKEIKQFKGILAETAIQLYLVQKCRIPFHQVHRWDLERDSIAKSRQKKARKDEKPHIQDDILYSSTQTNYDRRLQTWNG